MNVTIALFVLWVSVLTGAADDGRLDKRELKTLSIAARSDLAFSAAAKGRIADFRTLKSRAVMDHQERPVPYRQEYFVKMPNGMLTSLILDSSTLTYLDAAAIHGRVDMMRFLTTQHSFFLLPEFPSRLQHVGYFHAIGEDSGDTVDLFCGYYKGWHEGMRNAKLAAYPGFAFAVALGKEKAVKSFLHHYGILYPRTKKSTELCNSNLFALAAVNGHPRVVKQLLVARYEHVICGESARIAAIKNSLQCFPSVIVREICGYKGAEYEVQTSNLPKKVKDFTLPSMAKDVHGKTPLAYAQEELEKSDDENARERLLQCVDLLQNQDTTFMNFLFDQQEQKQSCPRSLAEKPCT